MLRASLDLEERVSLQGKLMLPDETDSKAAGRVKSYHRNLGKPIRTRFLEKVNKTDSCWLWMAKKEKYGYGRFAIRFKEFAAHRVAYELFKGEIPDGLTIDHLCKNPSCVNPDHLEPVTMRENLLRGNTFQARNAAKTHCKRGHAYDAENTQIVKGGRGCKKCRKINKQRYLFAQHTKDGWATA